LQIQVLDWFVSADALLCLAVLSGDLFADLEPLGGAQAVCNLPLVALLSGHSSQSAGWHSFHVKWIFLVSEDWTRQDSFFFEPARPSDCRAIWAL
jgi:hypothetical protein